MALSVQPRVYTICTGKYVLWFINGTIERDSVAELSVSEGSGEPWNVIGEMAVLRERYS